MTNRAYVVPAGHERGHALSWDTEGELNALMFAAIGQDEIDHGGPLRTPLGLVAVWSAASTAINEFAGAIIGQSTGALTLVTGVAVVTGMAEDGTPVGLTDSHMAALELTSRLWVDKSAIDRIHTEMEGAVRRGDIAQAFALVDELAEIAPRQAGLLRRMLAIKGWRRP